MRLAPPIASPLIAPVGTRAYAASARKNARRRRRDILMALLVAAGTTLVLGALPALRMLWLAHVVVDMLLLGYVALLIRQRNLATERDLKVRLLPTARRQQGGYDGAGWIGTEPALLRRSAN